MDLKIEYVHGDATRPQGTGRKIIAHVCNDVGGWGAGFVLALSQRWPEPEASYRRWYRERATSGFALGQVRLVEVEDDLWVANIVGQHGIRTRAGGGTAPVRYEAIGTALDALGARAAVLGASVHMPRIGCGLAGGHWDSVEPLVTRHLTRRGIPTAVYDRA
ncbi:Appr-1-p processing protein [Streptomyces albireticuli]|uniref:Appr-1-p processing protein n=1 Tax=Streptomyces albireticuli TaxID=1940 RepID=A0A1Z2LD36_9ACTN|nr:macro domain-containing protein [Streptomyces albireticuli]ARZ72230.1 Appr-1-p processing protein [Streptomyces albireticuli]